MAGAVGATAVVVAAATRNVPLLFVALVVYGAGSASNLQARYAGTDLAAPHERGRAASIALVSTTVGAVAGPVLVGALGQGALALGLPRLTGPFVLAAVAYAAAGVTLLSFLRPDPLLLARELERRTPAAAASGTGGGASGLILGRRKVVAGAATLLVATIAMVAIMTMTPVAMRNHDHGLADIGLVIGAHIAAMYLPSPISGLLADRWGRIPTALASVLVLVLAGVVAALASGNGLAGTMVGLALLGFGWNLGLVSGTAFIVDGTLPSRRPQVQGSVDVLVALCAAGAGAGSGLVVASFGYPVLAVASGLLAIVLLPLLARTRVPA